MTSSNSMPILKQFGDLTQMDFESSPVWVQCHVMDYDETWYDDTDEETFRPWDGPMPVDPANCIFLVRATFQLADGRELPGFFTPVSLADGDKFGFIQPYLFAGGRYYAYWGGMGGFIPGYKEAFYAAISSSTSGVFPLKFSANPELSLGVVSGILVGFYHSPDMDTVIVEK